MVIYFNMKMTSQEIWFQVGTPWRMVIISFSHVDRPRLRPLNAWIANSKGRPYWVSTTPILVPEASDSTPKVLMDLGDARIGVVHMALFNSVKAFPTIGV
jgi:hypothetical protein